MSEEIQDCLRLGWISYLNLYPLFYELKKNISGLFSLSCGNPAEVNALLRQNRVDLAPSSSICLLQDKPVESLPIGVVSKGKVHSVYLGFQKEHKEFKFFLEERTRELKKNINLEKSLDDLAQEILSFSKDEKFFSILPSIRLTKASQTSVELTRILLQALFGEVNAKKMQENSQVQTTPVELLIGDEALNRRQDFLEILDLGEFWGDLTGLPFVFAVWQGNRKLNSSLKTQLIELAFFTQQKMHADPNFYEKQFVKEMGRPRFHLSLSEYWQSLFYRVDDHSKRGLDLFLELAKKRI